MAPPSPSCQCRLCGSKPKHGILATASGRGAHYYWCPKCWSQGPLGASPRQALLGWERLMGGDKDAD